MPLPFTNNEQTLLQTIRFKPPKKACKKKFQEINEFKFVHNLSAKDCLTINKTTKQKRKEFKSSFKITGLNATYIRNCNGVLKLIEGVITPERMVQNKWRFIKYSTI